MKRILGIDVGDARVGIAISDELGMLAHARETIETRRTNALERIVEILTAENVETAVVGLPRNMDGSYGPAAEKIRAFAGALEARCPECKVRLWDERLTTAAAQRSLHAAGRNVKNSRHIIDQVAAQHILQSYLDSQPPAF